MTELLDAQKIIINLNNILNKDYSIMDDDELGDTLSNAVRTLEHLVFTLLEYKINNIRLIKASAIKTVKAIREGKVTLSPEMIKSEDKLAPILLEVVNKLDILDDSGGLCDVLFEVL